MSDTEQGHVPLHDAPPLSCLVRFYCAACESPVPLERIQIDVFERNYKHRQTVIVACEHCSSQHVYALVFDVGVLHLDGKPYHVVPARSVKAIFKAERNRHR
jgi:hypothetical protein